MKLALRYQAAAGLLSALASVACGPASFEPSFTKPVAPTELNVSKQIVSAAPRSERPVAVGITAAPSMLCAWDLSAGLLWELPVDATSNPLVVGDAIVIREHSGIVVRDLASGAIRVVVDDEGDLIGADGIGNRVVVTVAYPGEPVRSEVTFIEGEAVRWRQTLNLAVGVPALLGDRVLVPWASQRLSVLSALDGLELARWNFTNMVLGHALVDRGRVFIGEQGLLRVQEDLVDHRSGAVALYAPLKRGLPGQPPLMRDGSKPVPTPDSAANKLHLSFRVGLANAGQSTENDQLLLSFYRVVFGLAASADEVRWARTFERDVVGSSIEPGGAWLADDAGNLSFLDLTGATRYERALGKSLRSLSLRSAGFVPTLTAELAARPPVHDQLLAVAQLGDDRISPARAYAIDRLATLPDTNVTSELIAMCTDPSLPAFVSNSACARISTRDNGGPDVIEALRRRASFLEGAAAPPVGPLAQAAARMKLKAAAPLLVSQAEDPHTTSADLVAVFRALSALDFHSSLTTLERFVRLHHAEPEGSELTPALHAALAALGELRIKTSRPTLEDVARDAFSSPSVRARARDALGVLDSPPMVTRPDSVAAKTKTVEPPEPTPIEIDPRPYSLDLEAVQATLAPLHPALARCLSSDPARPKQARLSMIVAGDGSVDGMLVTPTSLQACMEPIVTHAKFPATRVGRQHLTQTLDAVESAQATAK